MQNEEEGGGIGGGVGGVGGGGAEEEEGIKRCGRNWTQVRRWWKRVQVLNGQQTSLDARKEKT